MNKNYTYVCPKCKTEQNVVVEFQTCSVKYTYDFESNTWEQRDIITGDHDAFACYNCGEDLPSELEQEIFNNL